MAVAAEVAAEVAGDGADIAALAADHLEHRAVRVRSVNQFEALDEERARSEIGQRPGPGAGIGALARDLHRRIGWRHLQDVASIGVERGADRGVVRPCVGTGDDAPLGVVGVGGLAPAYRESGSP